MGDNEHRGLNSSAKPWSPNAGHAQYADPSGYDGPQGAQQPPYQTPYTPNRGRGRGGGHNQHYNTNNNYGHQPMGGPAQGNAYYAPPPADQGYPAPPPNMSGGRGQPPMHGGNQGYSMGLNSGMGNRGRGGHSNYPGGGRNAQMAMQHQGSYMGGNMSHHQMPQGGFPQQPPMGAGMPRGGGGGGYGGAQQHMMGNQPMQTPPPGVGGYQPRGPNPLTQVPPPPNAQQQIRSPMPAGSQQPHAMAPMPPQVQQHVPPPPPPLTVQQQMAPNAAAAAVPTYMRTEAAPKVIVVTGYSRTGKTTVAREIAKTRGYEYISLAPGKIKDANRKNDSGEEDEEEEEDEEFLSLADRFAPLSELLARKQAIKGIVIDDALIYNKFEPYYVVFMLEKAGLHLDYLVIITTELDTLVERGVKFNSNKRMKSHPESFEFGSLLENHNAAANGSTPIAVVDGDADLATVVKESIQQLKDVESRGLPPLELPPVEFIPQCPLVSDPQVVDQVLAAERAGLGLQKLQYGFPYSEPNFLMEYVQFARHAALFKHYHLVPWVWGDKVSIIGHGDDVYVHLPSYKVLFHMQDVSLPLRGMIAQLKAKVEAEAAAADRSADPPADGVKPCLFSLEATMLNSVLYVSDMMVLGPHKGAKLLLTKRIQLMAEYLGNLPDTGSVRLLGHYHVREISKCLKQYAGVARGVLFVNPDGMAVSSYESRNFLYPSEDVKSVKIRIWGGRVEADGGMWIFDALASDSGRDTPIMNADGSTTLVYISNEDVDKFAVNDGDIVECIEEQTSNPTSQQKGKRSAKNQTPSTHLAFQRRCEWQVDPTTLYYQAAFLGKPTWATNLFLDACATIRYEEPRVATK